MDHVTDADYEVMPLEEFSSDNLLPVATPVATPTATAPLPTDLSYDEVLKFVQTNQIALVTTLTSKGMPEDKDGVKLVLETLRDLTNSAGQKKRLAIDETAVRSDAELAAAMALAVREHMGNQSPFIVPPGTAPVARVNRDEEAPAGLLDEFEAAVGETHIGVVRDTSEEFIPRMEALLSVEEREAMAIEREAKENSKNAQIED